MSDVAVRPSPEPRARLPFVVTLRAAQSLRRELARRPAHRVALALVALLIAWEWLIRGPGGADIAQVLRDVVWCAALSLSSTLTPSRGSSDFDALARMRGQPPGLHARALPLARVALAFSLHGGAALALGLALCFGHRAGGWLGALPVLLGILALSLLGALSLTALSWLSTRLLPSFATIVFFALLVVPTALHSSLFELPSLVDIWGRGIGWCLGWLQA